MTTKTIQETLHPIINNVPDTEVRTIRRCDIGLVPVHQGDIYIHRVADDHPRGKLAGTRQLALGTNLGARHMVEGDSVKVYEGAVGHERNRALLPLFENDRMRDECTGRLFTTRGPCSIPHPTHARHDIAIDEPGTYQVTHQWDETIMGRVVD